ncbi:unnamed protein product [Gongylonema pulchrum]|uniref:MMR_HSR1_Xtn domain-containing protein n=1 Tax=Gongylonema pulchrum TaxID=637853 RepID=A0A183DUC0_9BILA|nr:unnamed protein product [Gongylonema pulchrum]
MCYILVAEFVKDCSVTMIHVFNSPIDPTSLSEFEKAKGEETIFKGGTTVNLNAFMIITRSRDDGIQATAV